MTTQEAAVRDAVARYVAGVVPIEELADRLPDGWDLDEANDAALTDLALRVIGLVAEVHAGDRSEPEAKLELRPFAAWVSSSDLTMNALTHDLGLSVTTAAQFSAADTELAGVSW